jgi:hypothetical protein
VERAAIIDAHADKIHYAADDDEDDGIIAVADLPRANRGNGLIINDEAIDDEVDTDAERDKDDLPEDGMDSDEDSSDDSDPYGDDVGNDEDAVKRDDDEAEDDVEGLRRSRRATRGRTK